MAVYSTLEKAILHRLAESTGKAVDYAYANIVHSLGLTPRFFQEGGFGDLDVVNFHEDLKLFEKWPPAHFDGVHIDWRRRQRGTVEGAAYSIFQGSFRTPVAGRAYDALPEESRVAHVRWIAPDNPAPGAPTSIHLAATGDHGFTRRDHLTIPLVSKGVGSISLESPYYGLRKPVQQQGAKLRHVSDLLLLGRATIEESLLLLHMLLARGHTKLGVAGLSMGGVHATMVASLYPDSVALTPLLAPKSAGAAYCRGALFHATAWDRLLRDTEGREQEIVAAVEYAARANARVKAAKIKSEQVAARRKRQVETPLKSGAATAIVGGDDGEPLVSGDKSNVTAWHWQNIGKWALQWSQGLEAQVRRVRRLETQSGEGPQAAAVGLLEAVLETFTDSTRFPCPRRPDAAVLVAATEDAYVSPESVLELHRHLHGSEVRWVPGGHVSSFLLHQPTFRQAVLDSLDRL